MTLGLLVALENSDRHTDRQDSCFISIDIMVDLYSCINPIINYLNGVYIFSTIREVHKNSMTSTMSSSNDYDDMAFFK